jgi:hypothetical protein
MAKRDLGILSQMDLSKSFEPILSQAVKWVTDQEQIVLREGRHLTSDQLIDAWQAGVRHPDQIHLAVRPCIPAPNEGLLGLLNARLALITTNTGGLTLNYGIFVRDDCLENRRLLTHEFAHVAQYQRLGGIDGFLRVYVRECIEFGYKGSPLEIEAEQIARKIVGDQEG